MNKEISNKEIKKISEILKIDFSKEEIDFFVSELKKSLKGINEILKYADDYVNTNHFNIESINKLRPDKISNNNKDILKLSNFFDNKYIKV